jgi:hypothetical protein
MPRQLPAGVPWLVFTGPLANAGTADSASMITSRVTTVSFFISLFLSKSKMVWIVLYVLTSYDAPVFIAIWIGINIHHFFTT